MFLGLKVQAIFLLAAIAATLLFSTLFTYTYLSPEQSHGSADQYRTLQQRINAAHGHQYRAVNSSCSNARVKPLFDKLVFIVIDAFRSDFVQSTARDEVYKQHAFQMPFVERLLSRRSGLSAISRAQTPTVTLPKLKTILSGSTSNFIDILFNLNAAEFGTDNLIKQALNKKKRIVFYGDDTWLQMFNRSSFVRSNETLSFFARDYTTVDTNVTENMLPELSKTAEWDFLILHYLGVDHIGHSYGGINSKLLPAKLIEMDEVVRVIYEALSKLDEDYLIFVTGDHGMTDLGNHGGNTIEETNTAALMFTTNPNYRGPLTSSSGRSTIRIEQNDVSTLLSFYLGLRIPNTSKGKLDLRLLSSFGDLNNSNFNQIKLCYLFENVLQLQRMEGVASLNFVNYFLAAVEKHHSCIENGHQDPRQVREAEQNYDQYLSIIQRSLLDLKNENQSLSILLLSVVAQMAIFLALIAYQISSRSVVLKEIVSTRNPFSLIALAAIAVNIFSLGSTSFIENEHFYFNYIASTLIALHFYFAQRNQELSIRAVSPYFSVLLSLAILSNWTNCIGFIQSINSEVCSKILIFVCVSISLLLANSYLCHAVEAKLKRLFICFMFAQIFSFKWVWLYSLLGFKFISNELKSPSLSLSLSLSTDSIPTKMNTKSFPSSRTMRRRNSSTCSWPATRRSRFYRNS